MAWLSTVATAWFATCSCELSVTSCAEPSFIVATTRNGVDAPTVMGDAAPFNAIDATELGFTDVPPHPAHQIVATVTNTSAAMDRIIIDESLLLAIARAVRDGAGSIPTRDRSTIAIRDVVST
jgi:hypothetical protein